MDVARRGFLHAVAALGVTPLAHAAVRVIGLLTYSRRDEVEPRLQVFHEAMNAHGYVQGRDYVLEARYAEGDETKLAPLAADLLRRQPQLVLAVASVAIRALLQQTSTIPIVSLGTGDPVAAGFAQSLARPGRNFTGLSNMNVDTTPKLFEYLLRLTPGASRIALLYDAASASSASHRRNARDAAQRLTIEVAEFEVATPDDIDSSFTRMRQQRVRGLVVASSAFTISNATRIADGAKRIQLPSVSQNDVFADAGVLMAYGSDRALNFRLAADYVDHIFKGVRAGDLPIGQPTHFALTVNQRTARSLGLSIPRDILLEAQRLIE